MYTNFNIWLFFGANFTVFLDFNLKCSAYADSVPPSFFTPPPPEPFCVHATFPPLP